MGDPRAWMQIGGNASGSLGRCGHLQTHGPLRSHGRPGPGLPAFGVLAGRGGGSGTRTAAFCYHGDTPDVTGKDLPDGQ